MHYDLDWTQKLRTVHACAAAIANDPCFASFACVCDNGYLRYSDNMPSRPSDYDGFNSVIDGATLVNVSSAAAGNSDSD